MQPPDVLCFGLISLWCWEGSVLFSAALSLPLTAPRWLTLTLGLTSRVVLVEEDTGRLPEVVGGRLGPAAAVEGALAAAGFLSVVWGALVVLEDVGRLAAAAAEPPAAAVFGRVLAAVLGLVAPAAGCDAGPTRRGWMGGTQNKEGNQRNRREQMNKNGLQWQQRYVAQAAIKNHKNHVIKITS